jgi:hypothetical protein
MAGALRGQLGVQEQYPIQLVKIQCSADPVDGSVTFTSVDETVSGFIAKNEMARGTMKRVHQVCMQWFHPVTHDLTFVRVDSEWGQLCC